MTLFFVIQFISIQFVIALARHNGPAVSHFEYEGFSDDEKMKRELRKFHSSNSWLKFFFCLGCSIYALPDWTTCIATGLSSFMWIYLLFDPVLNKNRVGRTWYYLGKNDKDGRTWLKLFGPNAGKVKAAFLFALIIAINTVYYYVR